MSRKWKASRNIKCPFYQGERELCIYCEGIVSDKSRQDFLSIDEKHKFKVRYCCSHELSCPIRKLLESKY